MAILLVQPFNQLLMLLLHLLNNFLLQPQTSLEPHALVVSCTVYNTLLHAIRNVNVFSSLTFWTHRTGRHMLLGNVTYTPCQKTVQTYFCCVCLLHSESKTRPTIFSVHNFSKCLPIFKILSPLDSARNLK